MTDESWEEVEQGRVCVLRLRGPSGALDIFVIYHHTGNSVEAKQAREGARALLASRIRPQREALSVLMGDFNYVPDKRDRFSKEAGNGPCDHEVLEEDRFCRVIGNPFGFSELHQEEFTHDSALGRSRLDRVYTNHFITDQLDRRIGCVALSWVPWLSAHRPVAFFRQKPSFQTSAWYKLPTAPIKHPNWPRRVALRFNELRRQDELDDQPLRRLLLAKQAIAEVTRKVQLETKEALAESCDDRLGWTMRFIRAAEELRMGKMRRCANVYPHIATLANPEDPNLRISAQLNELRQHALELARTSVLEDMRRLYSKRQELNEMQQMVGRQGIQTRLKRLVSGSSTVLKAMRAADGTITADPCSIADSLRRHWVPPSARTPKTNMCLRHGSAKSFPMAGVVVLWQAYHVLSLTVGVCSVTMSSMQSRHRVTRWQDQTASHTAWRALGPLAVIFCSMRLKH